ncbi:MAG: hypothetical protein R3A12_10345 [Ignavibacteria bacterium]
MSASDKTIESLEGVFNKEDLVKKDKNIAKLHEQLSDDEFAKYWEEGNKLTMEEACQLIVSS